MHTSVVLSPITRQKIEYRLRTKDGLTRAETKKSVDAMLDYLIRASASDTPIAPGPLADSAWHAFILHTSEYGEFCRRNFGRVLGHAPTWPPKKAGEMKADCVPDPCTCCKIPDAAPTLATKSDCEVSMDCFIPNGTVNPNEALCMLPGKPSAYAQL